ncbi:alkylhydroperoxidase family enzyme [Prauserella sediminis]|uniref:Alkylhydroperoxidase family enzyme n=1 Tax=Prauserella sediminis TaxID=577680 RepID=A0A839XQW4_9PSEU|nr:carboxymuconolactone decarboxylase family protein [Prauserella sediminis]MBB3665600.1 alkylhydroperoxidase family enzyme [Prauserella sediminis]
MTSHRDTFPVRIPPRPRAEWDEEVEAAFSVLTRPGGAKRDPSTPRPPSNIMDVFAHHPNLARGWMTLNSHLFNSTLPARVRELVTIRIAWLRRGEYEWVQHVRMGKAVGLTEEEIAAVSGGSESVAWDRSDAAVLRATDEYAQDHYVSDETWAELAADLSTQQLMDLLFTIGAYDMLAIAMNSFGLQLDEGMTGFPEST